MARITCPISGIKFKCEHVPMSIASNDYAHPIFYLPQRKLLGLYTTYTKGNLTDTDSYLLFLALLHSTGNVSFSVPATQTNQTQFIIAANIAQLVRVMWQTDSIVHPSFRQPSYVVREDTADLSNIKLWIGAWSKNIIDFKQGLDRLSDLEKLTKIEKKLTKLIFTPEAGNIKLAAAAADWADKAAVFPKHKRETWKGIIRKCYNLSAMFSTPKKELMELKSYCEENLEVGSVHFHTLMNILKTGIANHNDFLGLGALEGTTKAKDCGYTLLETDNTKNEAALLDIISNAPIEAPIESNYQSKLAYLRAKLAYKQATKVSKGDL